MFEEFVEKIELHIKEMERATQLTKQCTQDLKKCMEQLEYLESLRSNKQKEIDDAN